MASGFRSWSGREYRSAARNARCSSPQRGANASLVTFFGGIRSTLERIEDVPAVQAMLNELDELRAALDELNEREAVMLESATPEQRARIEKALANLDQIGTLKSQLNEKVSELADETRTIKVLRRKATALEEQIAAA